MQPTIGQAAPDFEISNQHGEKTSLSSFKEQKNVLLMFYPFSFTGTCTGELCALRDDLSSFNNDDLQLLVVSCDSPFTQRVFAEQEKYEFPLLSDFWPHGAVSKLYGVFEESKGCALRGSFLVDKEGILRWEVKNGWVARDNADYKAAIAAL